MRIVNRKEFKDTIKPERYSISIVTLGDMDGIELSDEEENDQLMVVFDRDTAIDIINELMNRFKIGIGEL